jgi:PIN domain nuclease of toxin-antitoxin system
MDKALNLPGIVLAPLSSTTAIASTRLSGEIQGDAADRIIVATARHLGARLATADRPLLVYVGKRYLDVLAYTSSD